ncbi:MAG: hypothetical protein JOZ87_07395 [Chloroflexi bacterium]|nr:hypothetical protein [Chloroflexota bacterium]
MGGGFTKSAKVTSAWLLATLSGNVPEGDWLVDAIEYAVPDHQLYFHRVLRIPLGKAAPG